MSSTHSSSVSVRRSTWAWPKCHLGRGGDHWPVGAPKFSQQFARECAVIPAHCKDDVGPETGSKDVFKELDHAFQPMGESWTLPEGKEWHTWPLPAYLPIEKYDKGVDVLDLLLQLLHQLLHSLSVSLHLISEPCVSKLIASLFYLNPVFLPGVSITVTGFSSSPFHLIYQFIRTKDFQSLSQPYPNIAFSATLVYNGAFYRSKRRSNMLRCKPSGLGTGVFGDTLSPLSGHKALAAVRVFLILKVVSPT